MSIHDMRIRRETADDTIAIRAVNEAAFGRADEALLVDALRRDGAVLGSFVAERDDYVIGHILFSRMLIETRSDSVASVALAPLAVLPAHQRQGVGSKLVRVGVEWLRTRGERSVCVLGDPRFYVRFGFSPERASRLVTPFPPDAFMALELVPDARDEMTGTVRYAAAFGL